jgi:hypothetical protein
MATYPLNSRGLMLLLRRVVGKVIAVDMVLLGDSLFTIKACKLPKISKNWEAEILPCVRQMMESERGRNGKSD